MEGVQTRQLLHPFHIGANQFRDTEIGRQPEVFATKPRSSALLCGRLENFFDDFVKVPDNSSRKTRASAKEFMKVLQPKLDNNKYNIKFRSAIIFSGGCHGLPDRKQVSSHCVVYLPLHIAKCRARLHEPGYCCVSLPKAPQFERYAALRSKENAKLLSPMAAYEFCHELICHYARSVDGVQVLPLLSNTSDHREGIHHIVVTLAGAEKVEIVPSLQPRRQEGNDGVLIVAKPYCYDKDTQSDVLWRYSFREHENQLMQTVSMADGGVRVKSLAILLTIAEKDPALTSFSPSMLQALILQTIDKDVEDSLLWQQDRLQDCVLSALQHCVECVERKHLGHFFIKNFNIMEKVPDEVLSRLGRRLSRLLKNRNELLRLIAPNSSSGKRKLSLSTEKHNLGD